MSYTNPELVRSYLGSAYPGRDRVSDRSITLLGNDYVAFHDTAVDESATTVKANLSQKFSRVDVTFSTGKAQVGVTHLVPGSIVVASDSSLGRVFAESADYLVNYTTGALVIPDGSAIGSSQTVIVWFETFTTYSPGVDYVVDSRRAAIKRLSTGALSDGQTVLVDFSPMERQISDTLISTAIAEANAMIENDIDPNVEFGADPTLQAAATYRALESLCRASAMMELRRHFADDKIASTWIKLADQLGGRSTELIRAFRKPFTGPTTAAKT